MTILVRWVAVARITCHHEAMTKNHLTEEPTMSDFQMTEKFTTLASFNISNGHEVVDVVLVEAFKEVKLDSDLHDTGTGRTLFSVTDDRGTTIHETAPAAVAEGLARAGWANENLTAALSQEVK